VSSTKVLMFLLIAWWIERIILKSSNFLPPLFKNLLAKVE